MKKPLLLLLCLFTVIGYAKDPHIKAVYALIERVTPGYGKHAYGDKTAYRKAKAR